MAWAETKEPTAEQLNWLAQHGYTKDDVLNRADAGYLIATIINRKKKLI